MLICARIIHNFAIVLSCVLFIMLEGTASTAVEMFWQRMRENVDFPRSFARIIGTNRTVVSIPQKRCGKRKNHENVSKGLTK